MLKNLNNIMCQVVEYFSGRKIDLPRDNVLRCSNIT